MKVAPKADSIHEEFKLKQILFNTGIIKGRAGLRGNFTGAGSTATEERGIISSAVDYRRV